MALPMASGSEATRCVAHWCVMDSNFSAMPAVVARVDGSQQHRASASLFLAKTAYSVVLSVITGIVAGAYPCVPSTGRYLSGSRSASAFFLALERNDERVTEGSSHACSAALCRPVS